jgi:hypothetical protein
LLASLTCRNDKLMERGGNIGEDGTFPHLACGFRCPYGTRSSLVPAFPPVELAGYFHSSLRDSVPFLLSLPRTYVRGYCMPPLRAGLGGAGCVFLTTNATISFISAHNPQADAESNPYSGSGGNSSQRWWRCSRVWGPSSGKERPPHDDSGEKQVPPCSLRSRVGMTS